jgi:hypothetical protein
MSEALPNPPLQPPAAAQHTIIGDRVVPGVVRRLPSRRLVGESRSLKR